MPSFCVWSRKTEQTVLTRLRVQALTEAIEEMARTPPTRLVITGNNKFFSAGADLGEITQIRGAEAIEFAKMGQRLMKAVASFPSPTIAAVQGYCMGGGLDLALACSGRIAAPNAIFGHRGAALGLITGWGGHTTIAAPDWQGTGVADVPGGRKGPRAGGGANRAD